MVRHLALIKDKIVADVGSQQAAQDRLHHWTTLGTCNVKACYEFFRSKEPKPCWTKIVWHRSLMPKHYFILCLGLKERLLTRDRLTEQIDDTSCVLCGDPLESLDHLCFHCSLVRQVWAEIKSWLGFSRVLTTLKATTTWIIKEARGTGVQAEAKNTGFACTVYCIWKYRNARMFEGQVSLPNGIIRDIKIQVHRVLRETFPNLREL